MTMNKSGTAFQRFAGIESFGGILLLAAMAIAMIWANSPFADSYDSLWEYKIGFKSEDLDLVKPLRLWVNDGLMAIFFFLIGLEIKRELMIGELNTPRKAAFPIIAAVGGMAVPVAVFLLTNQNPETARGWGIPMATDIAFSLAILSLLGPRVPLGLKVFLTAFAIVDDLGAVLVIALFYSTGIQWHLLGIGLALIAFLGFLSYRQYFPRYFHLITGIVVWILFLKSGIHPTIAGVLLAFTVPIRQRVDLTAYTGNLEEIAQVLNTCQPNQKPVLTARQIEIIDDLEEWTQKVQSPLQQLEHSLHNWVSWVIMPVFALANAGITFKGAAPPDWNLLLAVALGLIAGKSIGIGVASWLAVRFRWVELPEGVRMPQILGVGFLAGVGFTMSIFIAGLAFANSPLFSDSAKMGILVGSVTSGLIGYLILRFANSGKK